jgi:hypothetical protein
MSDTSYFYIISLKSNLRKKKKIIKKYKPECISRVYQEWEMVRFVCLDNMIFLLGGVCAHEIVFLYIR